MKACILKTSYSMVPTGLWITQPQQPSRTCSTELLETGIPAEQTFLRLVFKPHIQTACRNSAVLKCSCISLVFLDTFWVLWQESLLNAIFRNTSNNYRRYLPLHTIWWWQGIAVWNTWAYTTFEQTVKDGAATAHLQFFKCNFGLSLSKCLGPLSLDPVL